MILLLRVVGGILCLSTGEAPQPPEQGIGVFAIGTTFEVG